MSVNDILDKDIAKVNDRAIICVPINTEQSIDFDDSDLLENIKVLLNYILKQRMKKALYNSFMPKKSTKERLTTNAETAPSFFLLKSEPTSYSISDLERDGRTEWTGVRNYQARNYLRATKAGDMALFYHSSATPQNRAKPEPPAIHGLAKVVGAPHADPTASDPKDDHYDPGHEWTAVTVEFVKKFAKPVTLTEIKKDKTLSKMRVAQRGQRLSVMPVTKAEFERVREMGQV